MRELNRHESQRQTFLGQRDRGQLLLLEGGENPVFFTATPQLRVMRHTRDDVQNSLKSIFGIVPTFLERDEDVIAVLTCRPSDHFQRQFPFLALHSHPNYISDEN